MHGLRHALIVDIDSGGVNITVYLSIIGRRSRKVGMLCMCAKHRLSLHALLHALQPALRILNCVHEHFRLGNTLVYMGTNLSCKLATVLLHTFLINGLPANLLSIIAT